MTNPDTQMPTWRIAVIGSGPSAFYAAQFALNQKDVDVRLDMFERLPVPFGLVRLGVAPDHQVVKRVVNIYNKVAASPGFRYFGNVELGRDLQIEDLERRYDQIIYAFGCSKSSNIGLPGEELAGVHGAAEMVGWYNGHPDFRGERYGLSEVEHAVVIGNGNVALDVARVLLQPPERLAPSDISDAALEELRRSSIREVSMLGRRGPVQAAYSAKELEEVDEVDDVELVVSKHEAEPDPKSAAWLEEHGSRGKQRSVRFLKTCSEREPDQHSRKFRCRFLLSPVAFLGSERVEAVRVEQMEIYEDDAGVLRSRSTGQTQDIPCQLVLLSVGYRGDPLPGVPYDDRNGAVPNTDGRVQHERGGDVRVGHFAVGWSKRGPSGIIGTNMADSRATVMCMMEDRRSDRALSPSSDQDTAELLRERGVEVVSWADWLRLDAWEVAEGKKRGKLRHKLETVAEMMRMIRELSDADESS